MSIAIFKLKEKHMKLYFESKLNVTADTLWQWIISKKGINTELSPILKMTSLDRFNIKHKDQLKLGQPMTISWIMLFGIIPIDRSKITLMAIEEGKYFIEQSPMIGMKLWRHKRSITEFATKGSVLIDELDFEPRFFKSVIIWFIKKLFENRHQQLKRIFGDI